MENKNDIKKNPLQQEKQEVLDGMLGPETEEKPTLKSKKKGKRGRPKGSGLKKPVTTTVVNREEIENYAKMIIDIANNQLVSKDLEPMNSLQIMLIQTGLVGVATKYNVSLDEYPEIALGGGILWVGFDKITELKKKKISSKKPSNNGSNNTDSNKK